jgi:uncharacterized protein YjbI with pentapeptide repeats
MDVTAPDLPDALEPWEAEPLADGFGIEGVRVGADLAGARATSGRFEQCELEGATLTGSRLRSVTMLDVVARRVDASNADWRGARLRRVVFEACRMTGANLAEADVENVVFRDCKLDLASFQLGRLRRVAFEGCVLDEATFSGTTLIDTRFAGSQLRRVELDGVRLTRVDLRGAQLEEPRGSVTGLRGSIVDPVQLVGLAPILADGLGITVAD